MTKWSKGMPSPNPKGRPPKTPRADGGPVIRGDGWYSNATGVGTTARDKRMSLAHMTIPVGRDEAEDLWQGDAMAARIIETLPNEMLREGFELSCSVVEKKEEKPKRGAPTKGSEADPIKTPDESAALEEVLEKRADRARRAARRDELDAETQDAIEQVEQAWSDLGLIEALWKALAYERAYGGAAILIGANDGSGTLSTPLGNNVSKISFLTVFEPRECIPLTWYTNPRAAKYGEPATYMLNPMGLGTSAEGKIKASLLGVEVHESRLLVFQGIRTSRLPRASTALSFGWGDNVLTRTKPVLQDFAHALASAGVLVSDFAQGVIGVKNLAHTLSAENAADWQARIELMDYTRSTLRAMIIDNENESFTRIQTPVSGLPELIDRFATYLAAAADMPLTLLMGQSPAGLNATGASDIRFFYDRVAAAQRRKLEPHIKRITTLIMKALGLDLEKWSIKFRPLWQPTEKEIADARNVQATSDATYIDRGVLTADQVKRARFGGAEYSYETVIDLEDDYDLEPLAPMPDDIRDPNAMLGEGAKPAAPPTPGVQVPTGGATPQATAMNGAQVTSMIEVVRTFFAEEIPREAAIAILSVGFPITPEQAASMLPERFKPKEPEPPPMPFGGGPPGAGGGKPPFPPKGEEAKPEEDEPAAKAKAPPFPPKGE